MNRSSAKTFEVSGIFDSVSGSTCGRLLDMCRNGRWSESDIQVTQPLIQQCHLLLGQEICGLATEEADGRPARLTRIETVDGLHPEQRRACVPFLRATTVMPKHWLKLEFPGGPLSTRIIDLFSPIGKGQRGLIVAPPKAGKTTLLQDIARAIQHNHPKCHLTILLVDERPEEVTDFQRSIGAELFASSNDETINRHLHVSQLAFQRAKHLAEAGRDVILLVDSLTRLVRAYNNVTAHGGRVMSGGLDSSAMEQPRQMFAMARDTQEIGSLTILATVLVETGSRMDDLIFQEFKGTGNAEIVLDRSAAELRLFPAINLQATGTRKEELLLDKKMLEWAQFMRRAAASSGKPEVALETLLNRMGKTQDNSEFVRLIGKI
ncbi:MAG: transcription termination factor Rho [Puniceicoccales bacterium]|jgi:transcription termination factor Rho|nr:transcription termination factor Rho [Puniceicoccales bacterium]